VNPPRPRSALLLVFLTVFIDLLGFGIVIPLLPIYSEQLKADTFELGLLVGSFSGMQLVFAPFWGRLSDRIGRRPVLVGGLLGTSASYVLFAFADTLPLLFASRMLAGFFGATVSTAQAYIADVTTPQNRAKGMGLIGAAFGLGFTLGPPLGGLLADAAGGAAPGLAAAGLSLAAAAFGFSRLPEPERRASRGRLPSQRALIREAFADPRARTLFLLQFLSIFAFAGFESMFTRYGLAEFPTRFGLAGAVADASKEDLHTAAKYAGYYFAYIGIVAALVQGGLIRRLLPRYGETKLAIVGPLILALAFVIVGVAPTAGGWIAVLVGCALMPFGFGLNNPALAGLTSRAAPPDRQGDRLGVAQSVGSFARLTGPPALGFLFQRVDPTAPFWCGAATLLIASYCAARFRARFGAALDADSLKPGAASAA
jgi:MFS transporter, DHA1 family, tetracycline resistance protein